MGRSIAHRGPDGEGYYSDSSIVFGMRRLSIIDVEGGDQPIASEDGSVQAVCNGEIFNFKRLRQQLLADGHSMRSGTDCEVLVHLYEDLGEQFCEQIDGMYGFAVWDRNRRTLVLGRDRLGVKPLYYWQDGRRLAFASEVKSLLQLPFIQSQLNPRALHDLLAFGYVAGEHSIFAGIRRLAPGTILTITPRGQTLRRYWRLPPGSNEAMSEADWVAAVRERMSAAVTAQMVSDVPIGAFLSGGLDSSSIVALMAQQSDEPIKTFAIGFDNSSGARIYDERVYARQMAKHIGARHSEIIVSPDVVALLPQLIWHLDEPVADSALFTTYLVARHAQGQVKVILSGVGGDEVFGGYPRYLGEHYRRYYNRIPKWLRLGLFSSMAKVLPGDRHSLTRNRIRYLKRFIAANEFDLERRYRGYSQIFDEHQLRDLGIPGPDGDDALAVAFKEAGGEEPLRQLLAADLATQLPDDLLLLTDKMTMAASLECRVPLLDVGLVELMATMPERVKMRGGRLKYLMKRAVADLLPPTILNRGKRGFGAPIGAWFRDELAPLATGLLSRYVVDKRGLLNWRAVERLLALHQSGREDCTDHLMTLVTLELWCRIFLDGRSAHDVAEELVRFVAPTGKAHALVRQRSTGRAAGVPVS